MMPGRKVVPIIGAQSWRRMATRLAEELEALVRFYESVMRDEDGPLDEWEDAKAVLAEFRDLEKK